MGEGGGQSADIFLSLISRYLSVKKFAFHELPVSLLPHVDLIQVSTSLFGTWWIKSANLHIHGMTWLLLLHGTPYGWDNIKTRKKLEFLPSHGTSTVNLLVAATSHMQQPLLRNICKKPKVSQSNHYNYL